MQIMDQDQHARANPQRFGAIHALYYYKPNNAPAAPGVPPGPGGDGAGDPGRGLRRRGSRTEFGGNRHQNFAQARTRSAAALCRRTGACGTSTTPPNDGKVPETAPCVGAQAKTAKN